MATVLVGTVLALTLAAVLIGVVATVAILAA
jgi:hypothetical protein